MIRVSGVSKRYGESAALRNISLTAGEDQPLVVCGPSGSGKTTLLRIIAGLETPDAGEVEIDGTPGRFLAPHLRDIGFVFQRSALWPHLTVAQNILFGVNGLPSAQKRRLAAELLERSGLSGMERRYPHQLSGGEARRVAILRALAPRPRHLLLDEPFTSLDADSKGAMLGLILERAGETRATVILVTHDLREAASVGGRRVELEIRDANIQHAAAR